MAARSTTCIALGPFPNKDKSTEVWAANQIPLPVPRSGPPLAEDPLRGTSSGPGLLPNFLGAFFGAVFELFGLLLAGLLGGAHRLLTHLFGPFNRLLGHL
jgi:hypothetical protein